MKQKNLNVLQKNYGTMCSDQLSHIAYVFIFEVEQFKMRIRSSIIDKSKLTMEN